MNCPWDLLEEDLEAQEFKPAAWRDDRCLKKRAVEVLSCLGQKRDDEVGRNGEVDARVGAVLPGFKHNVVGNEEVVVEGVYSDLCERVLEE